jgi:hypothetical protein
MEITDINDGIFGYLAGDLLVNISDNTPENPLSVKLTKFSDRFSQYIVKNRKNLIACITELIPMSVDFPEFKPAIYQATYGMLNSESVNPIGWYQEWKDLYNALRGFLLLTFTPQYTYLEILVSLGRENASKKSMNMASKFIGAYLGYNELIAQGTVISEFIENKINDLDYIKSKSWIITA